MVEPAAGVTLGTVAGWSRLVQTLALNVSKEQLRAILLPNGVPAAATAGRSAAVTAWGALSVLAEMVGVRVPEGAETEAHRPGKQGGQARRRGGRGGAGGGPERRGVCLLGRLPARRLRCSSRRCCRRRAASTCPSVPSRRRSSGGVPAVNGVFSRPFL